MLLLLTDGRFRLLWSGGVLAIFGHVMYSMVHGWLTLSVTGSPFWVGASSGMVGIGLLAFGILGGLVADRFRRSLAVAFSELVMGLRSVILAFLVLSGQVELWHLLAGSLVTGLSEAVRIPSMFALNIDVVGRQRLLSATAANFASFGVAGIVAPLAAGALVDRWDIGWAYMVMAAFHLLSAAVMLRLKAPPPAGRTEADAPPLSPWRSIREGIVHILSTPWIRTLLAMQLVGEAFGWSHITMLPVMARDVLGVEAQGLGYLMAASHAGFLMGNLSLSALGDLRHKSRMAVAGYGGYGLLLMLFAASRSFPLSLALLAAAYAVVSLYEANLHTMVQAAVPDRMRGRVISFQALTWGVTGFSGFYMGAAARRFGAPVAIAVGGAVVLANAVRLTPALSRSGPSQDSPR